MLSPVPHVQEPNALQETAGPYIGSFVSFCSRPRHVRLSSGTHREGEPASLEPWCSSTTPVHEISDPRRTIIVTNAVICPGYDVGPFTGLKRLLPTSRASHARRVLMKRESAAYLDRLAALGGMCAGTSLSRMVLSTVGSTGPMSTKSFKLCSYLDFASRAVGSIFSFA